MTPSALSMSVMSDDEVACFGRDPEAGFGAMQTERGLLPLTTLDVDARVAGVVASIDVAQTYVNTSGVAIEATYVFPLPDRMAVHRFHMEVNGRVVEGAIEERGAARASYDQALVDGHRASIAEEDRAGVFTLRVGNLMPGETAVVRLSLVGALAVDDGEVTFRFPLVVAPRYIPGAALPGPQAGTGIARDTDLVPDASRISPPVRLPGLPNPVRLAIRVALEDRVVRDARSSLHVVVSALRDAQVLELVPGDRLDRDFILRWRVDAAELRSVLTCADDEDGAAGTFLLTVVPPSTRSVGARPRDLVFVLDRSGSMQGWKIVAARRAVARMIDTLGDADRFCAIAFDHEVEMLGGTALVAATDRNRFRAVESLGAVDARGGTELAEPLMQAVRMLAGGTTDRERAVVLVTDGQVGNEDHILRELAPEVRNVRMFTLGIDQAVNAAFLRRLAAAGGGLCELVESEDRLDEVMAKVHRRIGTPVATELALRPRDLAIELETIAPHKLPDVYAGAPVVICGRYRGSARPTAAIEVVGTTDLATSAGSADGMVLTTPREPVAAPASWVTATWARAAIRDLEDRYAVRADEAIEARIVEISKRHGVLSRFTAFLAIDRSEAVNSGGRVDEIVQPVEVPAGWSDARPARSRRKEQGEATAVMPRPAPAVAPMLPTPAPMKGAPPTIFAAAPAPGPADWQTTRGGAPPAPPMGRPASVRSSVGKLASIGMPTGRVEELADVGCEGEAPLDTAAYRDTLRAIALDLDAAATRGATTHTAYARIHRRLREWLEDLRSVGADEDLANAVERVAIRIHAAFSKAAAQLAAHMHALAAELLALAGADEPPTAEPPGRARSGRAAFWK